MRGHKLSSKLEFLGERPFPLTPSPSPKGEGSTGTPRPLHRSA